MNAELFQEYLKLREDYVGRFAGSGKIYHHKSRAQDAYKIAKFNLKVKRLWDKYEYDDFSNRKGIVRLSVEPDTDWDYDNLTGDIFDPKANPDINPTLLAKQEREFRDEINRDGVWGIVGEWLQSCNHCKRQTWEIGGSCYGFVGDSWKELENDIKAETLAAAGLWDETE